MTAFDPQLLDWSKQDGLLPAIVQDGETLQVLMLGYMNREALEATLRDGRVTFYSRSKERLWIKGESSGHFLQLVGIETDCDHDALLVTAIPKGPTCHLERTSCFGERDAPGLGFLGKLTRIIDQRFRDRPAGSYTTRLFEEGLDRMAQKVGEEGVEVVIAAKNEDPAALVGEAADLFFHALVLMRAKSLSLSDIVDKLRARHGR